jgi:hypothetical protein
MNCIQLEHQRRQVTQLAMAWWAQHTHDPLCVTKEAPPPVAPLPMAPTDPEADVDAWPGKVAPRLDRYERPTGTNRAGRSGVRQS